MTRFQIANPSQYREEYPRLGAALGEPNASPAPGEVDFLADLTSRDWRRIGMLPRADIFFAAAVASITASPLALEIGTASGFSAAIFARMIALRQAQGGRNGSELLLHTIDRKADFVFDPAQRVGFAIDLIAPELRTRIAVHPEQDSSLCERLPRAREVRFAFVDGNHQHPWPLTDVLRLQRLMPGGWILLHDIDLPATIARAHAQGRATDLAGASGAKHVFDLWPDERISAGNIGAIRLPEDRRSLGHFVARLRELPAEVSPGSWTKQWREIDALSGRG